MFNHSYDNMLVNTLEVFDKSMTRNNECFQQSMKLQASASRYQFLSNAKNCNAKSPKDFSVWLESIPRYAHYTNRDPKEMAMMTSEGSLFSYVRELVLGGKNLPEIKPFLKSRFSECRNSTLAKHKLHQLEQGEMAMHSLKGNTQNC